MSEQTNIKSGGRLKRTFDLLVSQTKIKHRIIYVPSDLDPCKWQLQHRCFFFIWRNSCGKVSSAATAARELYDQMEKAG